MRVSLVFVFLLLFISDLLSDPSNYIVKVKASNCISEEDRLTTFFSTGFVYEENGNIQGVITSLHGVCGCKAISLENKYGDSIFDLVLIKADIENDVALLYSPDIRSHFNGGIQFAGFVQGEEKVSTYGYPHGIDAQIEIRIARVRGNESIVALEKLIPSGEKKILEYRDSPKLSINVLSLEMNITRGFSGAPILFNGKAIGIANGGLDEGRTGVCWAILTKEVSLKTLANIQPELDRLNSLRTISLIFNSSSSSISEFVNSHYLELEPFLLEEVMSKLLVLNNYCFYSRDTCPIIKIRYNVHFNITPSRRVAEYLGQILQEAYLGNCWHVENSFWPNVCPEGSSIHVSTNIHNEDYLNAVLDAISPFVIGDFDITYKYDESQKDQILICFGDNPLFNSMGQVKFK
ncbi:MAG: trypsin-like peptidase domain-containing protein [Bacteroidetes bacterium]|nr:trypsin-like peptidase domain-containing protein [Bacteroidota bacterium]